MRVLYVTSSPFRVSTGATLEGWLRLLRPRGLDPVVVTNVAGPFYEWVRSQGIPTYLQPLPRLNKSWPFPYLKSLWRLRSVAKRHGSRVVHVNEHDTYPGGFRVAKVLGLPVLVGIRFSMDRGFCEYAFRGSRQPDRMIFVSKGSLEVARPALTGVVPESAWRVIYNGTDLTHFKPDAEAGRAFRRAHNLGDGPLLGAATALRPVKQLEHLFEAAVRMNNPAVRVVVAGGPVPEYREYAENLIREGRERLGDRLVHLGHLDDLRGFFNAMTVFVSTSQAEGCSNSVLQSLACGCPVIGYPSVSVDEQVLPEGGAIAGQDRIDELTAALARWVDDPELVARGRAGARRQAERMFDINTIADDIWNEYRALAGAADRRGSPGAAQLAPSGR
jgi:glycosyltransferase involved in cell wall biosynthesis